MSVAIWASSMRAINLMSMLEERLICLGAVDSTVVLTIFAYVAFSVICFWVLFSISIDLMVCFLYGHPARSVLWGWWQLRHFLLGDLHWVCMWPSSEQTIIVDVQSFVM